MVLEKSHTSEFAKNGQIRPRYAEIDVLGFVSPCYIRNYVMGFWEGSERLPCFKGLRLVRTHHSLTLIPQVRKAALF